MKKWSLNKKIWSVFGLLILAFVGCTFLALNGMQKIGANLEEVTTVFVKKDQLTSAIQDSQRVLTITAFEQILETDNTKIETAKSRFSESLTKLKKQIIDYKNLANDKEKAFVGTFSEGLDKWLEAEKRAEGWRH